MAEGDTPPAGPLPALPTSGIGDELARLDAEIKSLDRQIQSLGVEIDDAVRVSDDSEADRLEGKRSNLEQQRGKDRVQRDRLVARAEDAAKQQAAAKAHADQVRGQQAIDDTVDFVRPDSPATVAASPAPTPPLIVDPLSSTVGPLQAQQRELDAEQAAQKEAAKGCLPKAIVIPAAIAAAVALLIGALVLLGGSSSKDTASTNSPVVTVNAVPGGPIGGTPAGAANPENPLDGHWVLVSGLDNPNGLDTSLQGFQSPNEPPGWKVTVDQSSATIDISGTTITGGTYKTGITGMAGDPCTILRSRVDLKASGNVDQTKAYGQLILDGTDERTEGCDSNHQPVVTTSPNFHTAHYFYVKDSTLNLCYVLAPTFDACSDPAGGSAATFHRL